MQLLDCTKKRLTLGCVWTSVEPIRNWFRSFPLMAISNLPENSTYALEKLRGLLNSAGLPADGKVADRACAFGDVRHQPPRHSAGVGSAGGRRPCLAAPGLGNLCRATPGRLERACQLAGRRHRSHGGHGSAPAHRAAVGPAGGRACQARDIERMYELAKKITASDDADSRELWDGALHRLIAESAGNQFFLTIFDVINHVRQDEAWQTIRELARSINKTRAASPMRSTWRSSTRLRRATRCARPKRCAQHLLMLQESLVRITSLDARSRQQEPRLKRWADQKHARTRHGRRGNRPRLQKTKIKQQGTT